MSPPRLTPPGSITDLWAGLAGGVFAPAASFGLDLPLWASLPGAVLVFVGIRLAFAPRGLFEGLDGTALDAARLDLAREVIMAAQADLARLRRAGLALRLPDVRARLDHLHTVAARVVADVERSPKRLPRVQRLLTYYLPAAMRLGEGFRVLEEANRPDRARLAATGAMIAQLDTVFARHADRLSLPEVEGLDVELRLLSDAIRAEERGMPEEHSRPEEHGRPETPTGPAPAAEPSPWR